MHLPDYALWRSAATGLGFEDGEAIVFGAPQVINTEVYARLPDSLRRNTARPPVPGYMSWLEMRGMGVASSFLEGPAFDRDGNLYCVELAHGRIFKVTPDREWHVIADYDGDPNGLKIHKDGRIFVADRRYGILTIDPNTYDRTKFEIPNQPKPFKGLNDLFFAENGDLYVTDQAFSGYESRTGTVYRIRHTGEYDMVVTGMAVPNGVVIGFEGRTLYVSETRTNRVMAMPVQFAHQGSPRRTLFLQLSGATSGPDGMAVDEEDNLVVAHSGMGSVWVFSKRGEPLYRVKSCAGYHTTNVAYGGPDRRTLFITESHEGVVLRARMPVPGKLLYSHM